MSSKGLAISVRGLSKSYTISHNAQNHTTMGEALLHRVKNPVQRSEKETFWALKDVNFDIYKGDVIGIIGRNGAGKSTLLKVLSQITEPTEGKINLYGRVGSLLEVGTGFHPELTGRENIFLNGAILGMKRKEIERQFDEIVEFASVEKFLDTPVKRYSSGMYVRLAFAVAAHLQSEILIVDEVLAVGDSQFQSKCLGKMGEVAKEGRTVIFVTHNMAFVQSLCQRAILLQGGGIQADDKVESVLPIFLESFNKSAVEDVNIRKDRKGAGESRFTSIEVFTGDKMRSETLVIGRPARFQFRISRGMPGLNCQFNVYNQQGLVVTGFNSAISSDQDEAFEDSETTLVCDIDEWLLAPGTYRINVQLSAGAVVQDHIESAIAFSVEEGQVQGRLVSSAVGYGIVSLPHRWASQGVDDYHSIV
jgi:lipopolysaccharide transport system ATP-binding protein